MRRICADCEHWKLADGSDDLCYLGDCGRGVTEPGKTPCVTGSGYACVGFRHSRQVESHEVWKDYIRFAEATTADGRPAVAIRDTRRNEVVAVLVFEDGLYSLLPPEKNAEVKLTGAMVEQGKDEIPF